MRAGATRWGNFPLVDAMYRDGFQDPLSGLIMGETAEILARQYGITREQSDQFALESQQKAEAAQKAGHFTREIAPVHGHRAKGKSRRASTADEHPRHGTTLEALAKLPLGVSERRRPARHHHGGIFVRHHRRRRRRWCSRRISGRPIANLTPLAQIAGWASAGVDPRLMGIGPVPAIAEAAASGPASSCRTSISSRSNEAFAPQVLAVLKDVPIPREKLNVNGGAIALGHPIGCTGARIVVTLLHEMQRRKVCGGLATLCVSGGMGMAMAVEVL